MKTRIRSTRRGTTGGPGLTAAAVAALASLAVGTAVRAADGASTPEGELSSGIRETGEDGRSSAFSTYRDLEDGFVFDFLSFSAASAGKPWFLDFEGVNLMRGDERYTLGFGKHGLLDVNLSFDRTPHLYSRKARGVLDGDGSRLRVPAQIQADFEALDDTTDPTYAAGDTPGTVTLAEDLVAATSLTDVGISRQTAKVGAAWQAGRSWRLRFDASSELKTGTRALGTGSYQRTAVGGGGAHSQDLFRALGTELPQPIDERTNRVGVGAHFARKRFMVDFGVEATSFDNAFEDVRWDNPFRATDVASGTFRNRFSTGLFDAAPDNTATTASVTGAVDLPARSRLTVMLSRTNVTQDDPFSPWTLNTAVSAAAGFDVTDRRNLPAEDLAGDVTTTSGSLLFTIRPVKKLDVTARFRSYDYANDSRRILFPGYAAFGDSAWLTNISGNPIENELQEYTRTNYGVEVSYRFVRQLAVQGAVGRESWEREERAVERTDEDVAGLTLLIDPADWLSVRAGWRTQSRELDGTYDPGLEDPDLRQFDQANRDRDVGRLQVDLTPGERVSVGLSYDLRNDDYPDSRRGLLESTGYTSGIDVAVDLTDRLSFYVLGGLDHLESDMLSTAKDNTFPDPTDPNVTVGPYLAENDWTSEVTDDMTEVGAGVRIVVVPDRLDVEASWTVAEGTTEFENANLTSRLILKTQRLQNSVAVPWPDIESRTSYGDLRLRWRLRPGVSLGLRWLYEDYDLDDFTWVPVRPYLFNQVNLTTGLTEVRRYLFLDSTYGRYQGSVVSLMMQYRF